MSDQQNDALLVYRAMPQARVTQGNGSARGLAEAIARAGAQRTLVITGPTIAESTGLLWYVEQILGPFHAGSYTGVRPHTPEATVTEAAEMVEAAAADALVSLGGGSAIDTVKAVVHAVSASHGRSLPHIAIPTTLSAAEFTHYAGVTGADGIKRAVTGDGLVPREVFLDPLVTLATPARLWLSSGVKALDHAIESMLGTRHHPVTDTLATEAIRRLVRALPACAADSAALAPRADAQIAAWMSLFSPATSRGGLSHALGHQLGARGVPHGVTSCITLPAVLRFVESATAERQAAIAAAIGTETMPADAVAALITSLNLPTRLRDAELPREALPTIAAAALPEAHRVSPVPIESEAALVRLLESIW
ncbi:MAG: iron-containing alcohol dehydrogenase [Dehalococcoidia bacterium]